MEWGIFDIRRSHRNPLIPDTVSKLAFGSECAVSLLGEVLAQRGLVIDRLPSQRRRRGLVVTLAACGPIFAWVCSQLV